jgi:hypothetical protein
MYFIHNILSNMFRPAFRPVLHTDSTSPTLCIKTHHITALVFTPQTLNNFNSHDFNIIHSKPVFVLFKIILTEIMLL